MPSTMTISLPDELKAFVEERARAGSFASSSEFIRQLVREDQKRAEREKLERMLLEGVESGEPIRVTDEYWKTLRASLNNGQNPAGAADGRTSGNLRQPIAIWPQSQSTLPTTISSAAITFLASARRSFEFLSRIRLREPSI